MAGSTKKRGSKKGSKGKHSKRKSAKKGSKGKNSKRKSTKKGSKAKPCKESKRRTRKVSLKKNGVLTYNGFMQKAYHDTNKGLKKEDRLSFGDVLKLVQDEGAWYKYKEEHGI